MDWAGGGGQGVLKGIMWLVTMASLLIFQLVWELLWTGEPANKTWELYQEEATICDSFFLGQKVYQVDKFISMCAQYRDNALSHRVVYEWTEMFKKGCTRDQCRALGSSNHSHNHTEWRKSYGNDSPKQKSDDQ
jgi:hypothetical protein